MPFKSQSQRRWMYATHPHMAKRWEKHTPSGKLPEKVSMDLTTIRAFRDEMEKIAKLPSALRSVGFRLTQPGAIQAMHGSQYGAARQMRALHGAQAAQSIAQKAPGQVSQKFISQGQRAKAIGQQGLPQAAPAVPQIAPVTPGAAPGAAPMRAGPPAGMPERRAASRALGIEA